MLAGYLPFDDDPANPEGDNINLLYKYIVSTPLTFPEYVTPHARDLLRRILVPDPRQRADLFEVARHSWLSEYSHVVGFITSTTTTTDQIGSTTVIDEQEPPTLNRSSSVREPVKQKSPATVGDLSRKHGNVDPIGPEAQAKIAKDNKRRTVQVEYVAPKSQTRRGELSPSAPAAAPVVSRSRTRPGSQGPVEVPPTQQSRRKGSTEKSHPQDPHPYGGQGRRGSNSSRSQGMAPPPRPGRHVPRSVSDANHLTGHAPPPVSIARPNTGGSMTSSGSRPGSLALRDRGSYSQPAAPAVAGTNAQGRMSQPQPKSNHYNISAPTVESDPDSGKPGAHQVPAKSAKVSGLQNKAIAPSPEAKGHRRSNTIGGIFNRPNSFFGGKPQEKSEKPKKSYPPVSMGGGQRDVQSRPSMDSRRSISFGFGKKRSGSITSNSQTTLPDKPRRFSLLPASFSLKQIGITKEYGTPGAPPDGQCDDRPDSQDDYAASHGSDHRNTSGVTSAPAPHTSDGTYDHGGDNGSPPPAAHQVRDVYNVTNARSGAAQPDQVTSFRPGDLSHNTESESSLGETAPRRAPYPPGFNSYDDDARRPPQIPQAPGRAGRGVLQKNNRKFGDAYEQEQNNGYGPSHADHAGSSGAARKVMDFFRRRGRDRG